ncbi:uncharacterized protein LOC129242377 [Anastrepha obliqua]|uniref:uncharacterized protein LOC129242377 n=1 Tax=Anastrepha obliqua TaxID=95512 RepID=UPI00240A5A0B|nr:uncharacterized protein LOC129242377 [Anastrepha obliqua]XP_054734959.1 uncharacterized protein LOC129242377 [Anastrepha obliqua]XP_054734960.1 uncharacterized protein LOC129242377 [Anastrepha obliqua]
MSYYRQRLKYSEIISAILLLVVHIPLMRAVKTIDLTTEYTLESKSTAINNRGSKLLKNSMPPKAAVRMDSFDNRGAEKREEPSKQLLAKMSSKSYISKPNSTTAPTPAKLAKRAGSTAEIKQKKISKENTNRTGDTAARSKLRQEADHIPDSSGHIPYRIGRPHLASPEYDSTGVSSISNDGGEPYQTVSYEADKWPNDYWERDYNKHFSFNTTRVQHIEAECQDDYMKIRIGFNATFSGLVYSAGYAYDPDCMYINGSGRDYYEFYIQLNRCGTLGKNALHDEKRKNPTNFMWNTVTVQYNPLIEEEYDEHFKVTCEYGYDFWKTVTFPFLDVEVATGNPVVFTLSPPECYMEIQNGYGIGGPRVTGPVRVGDPLTLIIYMRSKYDGFDIVVNDCYAHNGANKRIQLIDEYGCPVDDKLISRFRGSWSDSGVFETQVYAYMKTFRFTGSPALYIECDVRMCHGRCPSQPCHWRNLKAVTKRDISNSTASKFQSTLEPTTPANMEGTIMLKDSSFDSTTIAGEEVMTSTGNPVSSLSENVNLFQSLRVLQEGESEGDDVYSYARHLEPSKHQTCLKTTTFSALTVTFSVVMCVLSGALMVACSRLKQRSKDASLYDTYITHKGQID